MARKAQSRWQRDPEGMRKRMLYCHVGNKNALNLAIGSLGGQPGFASAVDPAAVGRSPYSPDSKTVKEHAT